MLCSGLGQADGATLRLVSSQPTEATWSFVVEDHSHTAELLIDGRNRSQGCIRHGSILRCDLHGLFPGGHTAELRLPGAVLRRSVVVGKWPERPMFVRVVDEDLIRRAAELRIDGVIVAASAIDLVEVAHARGLRVLVEGLTDAELELALERSCADGVVGQVVASPARERFPQTHSFSIEHKEPGEKIDRVIATQGLTDAHGRAQAALALLGQGQGMIIDSSALDLAAVRKGHPAFRRGTVSNLTEEQGRARCELVSGNDRVTFLFNNGAAVWNIRSQKAPLYQDRAQFHAPNLELQPGGVAILAGFAQSAVTNF